jgi:DNA-binding response OmpR family regulator
MKKILIIEDEKILVEMYKSKLEANNFEVISAFSSEEGIKILRKEKPDLVILDMLLPKENGITFLEKIEKIKVISDIRIVVFSNYDDPETRKKAFRLGVEDYLIKTQFTPREFLEKVKEYFRKKPRVK